MTEPVVPVARRERAPHHVSRASAAIATGTVLNDRARSGHQASILVGAIVPSALVTAVFATGGMIPALVGGPAVVMGLVAVLVLAGLYLYEAAFVRAGQLPPLS